MEKEIKVEHLVMRRISELELYKQAGNGNNETDKMIRFNMSLLNFLRYE